MEQDLRGAALREPLPQDSEQLKELWCDAFGDPPELVDAFLPLLPGMGCGCVAEHDGRILGAAYLIHGFTLLRPGKPSLRCGYLYAVAVRPEARGRGLGAAVRPSGRKPAAGDSAPRSAAEPPNWAGFTVRS